MVVKSEWDLSELRAVLASLAGVFDGDEPVDELAHALQCATLAWRSGADPQLMAAALLHDIGRSAEVVAVFGNLPHEVAGSRWVARRGHEREAWLIGAHVPAKVWLVGNDPAYTKGLSPESRLSLRRQQDVDLGPWVSHAWWPDALQLRRWDDAAKVPGAATLELEELLSLFANQPSAQD